MGYITLLSDLGLQDASVAIAKGVLMQYANGYDIIDITHAVAPFNTKQAAYMLGASYKSFPAGSCHIVLFDLFSEATPSLLLCAHEGHYFLFPDNGCVPLALGTVPANTWQCATLKKGDTFNDWLMAAGKIVSSLDELQLITAILPAYELKEVPKSIEFIPGTGIIDCEVIHIDRYENAVINVTRQQFEAIGGGRQFRLQFMLVEEINEVSSGYADVREGIKLCRFNNNDHLEICINRGKAASLFGLRLGSRNNDIKILFE